MLKKACNLISFVWSHPNNKGHRLSAIGRILRWQIACRLIPGPISLPYVRGTFLLASRGMTAATGNWYCGMLEYEDMQFVLHMLRKGDLFLDVGANIGSYSILAATTGADVIAIEPIPKTYEVLKHNIVLNKFSHLITPYNFGLGSNSGELRFTSDLDCVNHVLASDELVNDTIDVAVYRMDDISLPKIPTMIKIDVEGYESEVIAGATPILSSPDLKAVIMEQNGLGNRYGYQDVNLSRIMSDLDFVEVIYDHYTRSFLQGQSSNKCSSNTIFVKKQWLKCL